MKFKEGVGSSIEVMQAETELKTAQNNYLGAIYDLIISKLDYYQATGKNIK
jgi:outer membrane protein TolC